MTEKAVRQREVWICQLDPARGHEQAGTRPAVAISVDEFGVGSSELAIVVPLTTTRIESPLHVAIEPPEGGLRAPSLALPQMVRSISHERLVERLGAIRPTTLAVILARVRLLIRAPR